MDISMLEMHNGKERDLDDWKQLFASADKRFRIVSVKQPPSSRLGLLEVEWTPDSFI